MNSQPAYKLPEILNTPDAKPARETSEPAREEPACEEPACKDSGTDAAVCFARHQDELRNYLVQRFGSVALAERVVPETKARLLESDVLLLVGNPRVYIMGYALSLGLQFLQEDAARLWHPERES